MSTSLDQWAFTSPHEGVVPHLYLDTSGNVTAGVGFLIPDENALRRLPWSPGVESALMDYQLVRKAPPGKLAAYYRPLCHARLTPEVMRSVFDGHVLSFRAELQRRGWRLERLPLEAQIGVVDMCFNLGPARLELFTEFRKGVQARDWRKAAAECHRKRPVSEARNAATRDLFLACLGAQ